LDAEAGGHRIQRIPPTEKRGRVHTSSVTVSVLDGARSISPIQLSKDDVIIEWFSGTGKGGQHRNKHQNSCRVIHRASGLVESRQGRHRNHNLEEALMSLEKRLTAASHDQQQASANTVRQAQIGQGLRGDKIRTYRFQDDRVVDHQTGKQAKCSKVMKGRFDLLWTD
jgi:peptide chain release factor 1